MGGGMHVCSYGMESEHKTERENIPGIYSMTSPVLEAFEGGIATSVNLREGRVMCADGEGKRGDSMQFRVADLPVRVYTLRRR